MKNIYVVIDRQTKIIVGRYKTLKSAKRKADKLDNVYGGYRYYIDLDL